jgi:hypothetical protein
VCLAGVFIGQKAEGEGGQEVASAGALAMCDEQHQVRRPCSRAGGDLSWLRGSVGRRWRGHGGRQHAESRGRREGGPGRVLPLLLQVSRLKLGQRGLGSTAEDSSTMATGSRRTGTVRLTVKSIFWIFAHHMFDQMPARISNLNF